MRSSLYIDIFLDEEFYITLGSVNKTLEGSIKRFCVLNNAVYSKIINNAGNVCKYIIYESDEFRNKGIADLEIAVKSNYIVTSISFFDKGIYGIRLRTNKGTACKEIGLPELRAFMKENEHSEGCKMLCSYKRKYINLKNDMKCEVTQSNNCNEYCRYYTQPIYNLKLTKYKVEIVYVKNSDGTYGINKIKRITK